MSRRELRSLTSEGTVATLSRLRSGKHEQPATMSTSDLETETHEDDAPETPLVQELRQKLAIVATELETVRAELTTQLQQTIEMADNAKEESEEQRRRAQDLECELETKSQVVHELEEELGREKEQWETIRMRTELDGLKQLEDVRRQFDRERERHRKELEQQASVIEKLKQELATEREKTSRRVVVPPGISSETVDNLHVHEESTTVTGNASGAVDGVLMHEGDAAVGGGENCKSKKVTFTEPGKGHEKDSSVGELGSLSDGGSGENCTTGVTTSQSLSGGVSDSSTTVVTTQTSGLISSSDVSVVTTRPTSLTNSVTSSSDTSPSVVTTRPTMASSLGGSGLITSSVVSTRSASGSDLFGGGGSLDLGNVSGGVAGVPHVPVVRGTAAGGSVDGVMQQLTQLVQTQTAMVAAQTRAMSAQSLPPMSHYSGEGSQSCEDGFDKWVEQFEERAKLVGWSEDHRKYHLKMLLDGAAFQTYKLLSDEVKASYSATVDALKTRFKPVDIEELRGMEFHQLFQKNQSIEELGIELQRLAKRAFPAITGKDFDRLLKGRFFQALLPRWQRKLGAPKPDESFDELFSRARTTERREQQYSEVAGERSDSQREAKKVERASTQPQNKEQNSQGNNSETRRSENRRSGQGPQCHACHRFGHIARNCRFRHRRSAEAPGRSQDSNSRLVTSAAGLSDEQLEEELTKRRIDKEQELVDECMESSVNVVTGAVGPSYWLQISVEGVVVPALVDTGSQSTIISRPLLHKVFCHLKKAGKELPKLEYPCTKFKGKGGHPINVTAQVQFTLAVDGRSTTVPVFVQPDSEQECLLGSNVLPSLGITVTRASGEPLTASIKSEKKPAQVNLVQATAIPGMKGCYVKARVDQEQFRGDELLFEPESKKLESLGVSALESLVSIDRDGHMLIPIHNYQGVCVKLSEGTQLGAVRVCKIPKEVKVESDTLSVKEVQEGVCAHVSVAGDNSERFDELFKTLDLPETKLTFAEMTELKGLLKESTDVFALSDSELGCTDIVQHSIDTGNHAPIKQQPYRTPIVRRDQIKKMIDQMQKQGIVQPSKSSWASPIVLVPKKDGSLRFCVDYRKLNSITRRDVFPLPRVDDIFDTLNGAKYFTSLDLASGYWQVELDEDARTKSAFTTYNGLFEFVRMPFGLCNAPATFQRVMQIVLAGLEWQSCFVYLDDILIASKTFSEHIQHIREVFARLRAAGLRLKPKKCLFLREEVPYLGHLISAQGIRPDPSKTEKVKMFPTPCDVTAVRQFIGLTSYYRRFVPNFSNIASPLRALTKKNAVFKWSSECQSAFERMKQMLTTAPILAYPKFGPDAEFVLETDASGIGLGAVLSQQPDGMLHPIAYASRSLDSSERNYGITELETLAVVWAARYFRPYLLGHRTIVYTDHSACVSVLSSARPSGKLARWALTIQELNLIIKHRAGKLNANADALSRNPCEVLKNPYKVDELSVDVCFECPNVSVFTSSRLPDDVHSAGVASAGVASAGLKEDDCKAKSSLCSDRIDSDDSSLCLDSQEPTIDFNDSMPSIACLDLPTKSDCLDTCKVEVYDTAGVDCHVKSDSLKVCSSSEDYVASNGDDGVNSECLGSVCDCQVLSVDVNDVNAFEASPLQVKEANEELRQLQLQDIDLASYIEYLERNLLPPDECDARKVVLGSKQYEMIDGILHYENPLHPGRWCVVVPTVLRQQLLEEAHAGAFSGHFSEKKVYDKILRRYWWYGIRADVRRFCRSCLNCATRKGPGRPVRPPMQPIPVKGPFHRVAVDVLQLPVTSSGNKYIVVFMDYLTKWVEAFPTSDQKTSTIAALLVEHIVCRHGIPEELLSDRGSNFLSDLMLELCSILGVRKINTSGYHPQTDGLVEKFNSTLQSMIAKSSDKHATEWDKQLPLLLFAYRSVVQESTKESPFFLLYGRDPRLPTGTLLEQSRTTYLVDLDDYRTELVVNFKKARELALRSIKEAQEKQ